MIENQERANIEIKEISI